MAEKFTPIPNRSPLTNESGLISQAWRQFLNAIFGDIYKRIETLETQSADYESRIDALENP
jgi:uncharacterized protein YceH (UPF0502 family)